MRRLAKSVLIVSLTVTAGVSLFPAAALATNSTDAVDQKAMYRLYNPNSGEHFYTASNFEAESLTDVGWDYEGVGWVAPASSGSPVYRLYNPNAGDHHYTLSAAERDSLVGVGWRYEGVGWYSDDARTVPLYRQYNPNARAGAHNFTTSQEERDGLVSVGWRSRRARRRGTAWSRWAGGTRAPAGTASARGRTTRIREFSHVRLSWVCLPQRSTRWLRITIESESLIPLAPTPSMGRPISELFALS